MQESLTNISRYAKATKADISLSKLDDNLCFTISDNGIGISDSHLKSKKSFGLIGMKERSASLGGTLEVSRGEKSGTVVQMSFPLNFKEATEGTDLLEPNPDKKTT